MVLLHGGSEFLPISLRCRVMRAIRALRGAFELLGEGRVNVDAETLAEAAYTAAVDGVDPHPVFCI